MKIQTKFKLISVLVWVMAILCAFMLFVTLRYRNVPALITVPMFGLGALILNYMLREARFVQQCREAKEWARQAEQQNPQV